MWSFCIGTEVESRLLVHGKVSVWVDEFRLAVRGALWERYAMLTCQLYCFCRQVNLRHSFRVKLSQWRHTSLCSLLRFTPPTGLRQCNLQSTLQHTNTISSQQTHPVTLTCEKHTAHNNKLESIRESWSYSHGNKKVHPYSIQFFTRPYIKSYIILKPL